MWPWGSSSDKPQAPAKESPPAAAPAAESKESFDPKKLPNREKLPPNLQKIIDRTDKEENFFDELVEG